MPSMMENVSILSHAIRTLVALVVVGALGVGSWFGYSIFDSKNRESRQTAAALAAAEGRLKRAALELEQKDQQITLLEVTVTEQEEEIDRLDTAMRLLKVDHRIARLSVIDQRPDATTDELSTVIAFQEIDDRGEAVGEARRFEIPGDVVYLDSWVVKFDDKYVEQADLHRSTSLVLFRRLFGEDQSPTEGFALDQFGSRPGIYGRGGKMTEFEKQIWGDFWSVANDQGLQNEMGIRAAHGEAPSIKVQPGKAYRITLRASGGLTVQVEENAETPREKKPAA
jgi:hypothetical protein